MTGPGEGNGFGGFGDDDLIKDIPIDFDESDFDSSYDPYGGGYSGRSRPIDRGTIESLVRVIESLGGTVGGAVPPEAREQLERIMRDLLVALRDAIDWTIQRIDEHSTDEIEIEEIPVD